MIADRRQMIYQGTIVILNPTSAHTLNEVIVETAISTRAVNAIPSLEWIESIRLTDQAT
jgi:hypothetical protein